MSTAALMEGRPCVRFLPGIRADCIMNTAALMVRYPSVRFLPGIRADCIMSTAAFKEGRPCVRFLPGIRADCTMSTAALMVRCPCVPFLSGIWVYCTMMQCVFHGSLPTQDINYAVYCAKSSREQAEAESLSTNRWKSSWVFSRVAGTIGFTSRVESTLKMALAFTDKGTGETTQRQHII